MDEAPGFLMIFARYEDSSVSTAINPKETMP
jgi:hypothetical protein